MTVPQPIYSIHREISAEKKVQNRDSKDIPKNLSGLIYRALEKIKNY